MADIIGNEQWVFIPSTESEETQQVFLPSNSLLITNYDLVKDASDPDIVILEKDSTMESLPPEYFPPLPDVDASENYVQKDMFYSYNNDVYQCIQGHTRTIYPPAETPALFSFYRTNSDDLLWIPNERVAVGWKRLYNDILYEVITEHMTQETWTPDVTPALWKLAPTGDIPNWVQPTGAHDAYNTGDQVTHNNAVWESTIDANVWEPGVYGWNKLYDL